MDPPPWSQKQLRHLGEHLRDGGAVRANGPSYDDVLLWYNDLAAEVQRRIARIDREPILGARPFEITSRAKTIDTLRDKLRRDHSTPLSSIQDLAGVRFEAEMSLDEQDDVATCILEEFGHDASCLHDLRRTPHSGYRAVHLWLRLPARVEVQVRTHMQGMWANTYEAAADALGRLIRYGEWPDDPQQIEVVRGLQNLSLGQIAEIEQIRNNIGRLEVENRERLHEVDLFDVDDTLPNAVADAMDLAARIDEMRARALSRERSLQDSLIVVRRIFMEMSGGA